MLRYHFGLLFQIIVMFWTSKAIDFHIGVLGPFEKDIFGFKRAVDLAFETIKNSSILQGHRLIPHFKETATRSSVAIDSLISLKDLNSSEAVKTFIIGPAVSKCATYTARLSTVWGPLQLSYGASSLELLNSETYPRFLTVIPTSRSVNKAAIKLMEFFKWKRVGIIYDVNDKEFFLPTRNELQHSLLSQHIEIVVEEGMSTKKLGDDSVVHGIQQMKKKDVRIIIALLRQQDIPDLLCEAYKQGVYGQKIVWITYMNNGGFFISRHCNSTQLEQVTDGMLVLDLAYLRTDQKKTVSGLTVDDYKSLLGYRRTIKHSLAFDTTWLVALALNASLKQAVTLQTSKTVSEFEILDDIKKKLLKIEFEGISGHVKFNDTERLGTVIIRQIRNRGYNMIDIAEHVTRSGVLTIIDNKTKNALLNDNIIRDGPTDVHEIHYYSSVLCVVIWIISSVGIIVALGLFYFNFKNREIRYIKMSSPHMNNIIILGGLLCYIKVILDTLDSKFMSLETYGLFCNIRVWFMSLGFTSAFGAMFSKTWRVHRIFTASQNFRRAVIKNFHLYGLLIGLIAIDITLLLLWMLLSPYKYDILQLPSKALPEEDTILHPAIYHCTSEHGNYFLITTFCYKGLLLIFGIFLAWETRNIEIKALNDSRYIGMSVYNVVILSVVGVIIAALMSGTKRYDLYLALMSIVVVLVTATTLGIVFVPKIVGLQHVLNATNNECQDTSYTATSNGDTDSPCCCCDNCKCRCRRRTSSIHVNNKFLASASNNRRKGSVRKPSLPSISVTKPKVSVHIDARVSLSTCREEMPSPQDSPRIAFLGVKS